MPPGKLFRPVVLPLPLLALLLPLLSLPCSAHLPLEVSLGRFNNLVIGIDRSVPENATLIEEIKDVLTEASIAMVIATRRSGQPGGLTLGNVSILVPDTWPERPHYAPATWQVFSKSQLRVGPQNPRYGPVPHTEGSGGCGVPGQFTHYPTDFFLDKAQAERLFGRRSRLVLHEWGHLRWGVMDEAPQEGDPQFYIYNNKFYPTRCTEQLDGKMANRHTGLPCKIDRQTMTPEPDCIFIPDENNRAAASYMGHYYVNSVRTYCDHTSTPDESYRHNRMAPTAQNRICRSRSIWQVIGNHEDFSKEIPIEVEPRPNIEVVRARQRRVVAVLDVSGSMISPSETPFLKLKAAMINYIRRVLEPKSWLGIVTFSSGTKVIARLQQLGPINGSLRNSLENDINDLQSYGYTDIGDGLMLGLDLLQTGSDGGGGGGSIFLVSDGEEQRSITSKYTFVQAADAIKAAGVTVDVLGLGPEADKRIGDLARDTGGNFYSSFNTRNSFDLLSAMLESAAKAATGPGTPVLLQSVDIVPTTTAAALGVTAAVAAIDTTARGSLQFVLLFPMDSARMAFNLTSPSGRLYGEGSPGFRRDAKLFMASMDIDEAAFEPGLWTVNVDAPPKSLSPVANDADRAVSLVISSRPKSDSERRQQPIAASAGLSTFQLANNSAEAAGDGVVIDAALRSGPAAVLGARVTASVRTPDNRRLAVVLLDNGAGRDLRRDDGVYTGLLSPRQLTGIGDYLVSVSVESVDGATGIVVAPPVGANEFVGGPTAKDTRANYTLQPVTNLTRNSLAGSFKLDDFSKEESQIDRVPPSDIASLDLTSVNASAGVMTVTWIAVGDDYDQGKASRYEAFWATDAASLTNPESDAQPVLPGNVHHGSLTSPQDAGRREILGLHFPDAAASSTVVYVTLRAVDAAGNRGGFAFPTSAAFQELPFAETGGPGGPEPGGSSNLGVIIGVVVSVVVVAVVIAAVYFGFRKPASGGGRSLGGTSSSSSSGGGGMKHNHGFHSTP